MPLSELRLRPRTVTDIVDAAFALYRRDALAYIVVAAIASAPSLVIELLALPLEGTANGAMYDLLDRIVSLVTYSLMSAVIVKMGATVYLGGEADVATTLKDVLPRLPSLLAVTMMKGILFVFGVLALLVGLFYVAARYFAVEQAVVLEGVSSSAAFTRSSQLSEGLKWHVLLTLALVYVIFFVLVAGVIVLASFVTSQAMGLVIITSAIIVVYPLIALAQMVLYYDSRIRNEGFDIEQMAGSLEPAPAS